MRSPSPSPSMRPRHRSSTNAPAGPAGPELPAPGRLTRLPIAARWVLLVALSVALAVAMELARLPAALLLGTMIAAILFAINGARMSVGKVPFFGAQAVVGCLVAKAIDPGIVDTLASGWPMFLGVVLAIILLTSIIGYAVARSRVLPGTTALWGTSAGASTSMIIMADEHGADARLVAFMQYTRVAMVVAAASLVAAYGFGVESGEAAPTVWFPPVDWANLALMLAVAFASSFAGALLRLPSGALFAPLITTSVLHALGWLTIELPDWLLAIAFALIGWRVGLGFTRSILRHAASALPQIVASIVVLIAFCGGLAYVLTVAMGVDGLTAYLATSPGGLESVAIIASSTPVDVPFVMAMQTMRVLLIMLLGPMIVRIVAGRLRE